MIALLVIVNTLGYAVGLAVLGLLAWDTWPGIWAGPGRLIPAAIILLLSWWVKGLVGRALSHLVIRWYVNGTLRQALPERKISR